MAGLKYIGPKGKGPERPVLGPYFDYAGNYCIPFDDLDNDAVLNAIESYLRSGELYITCTWNEYGEVDHTMNMYILYQKDDLKEYNLRPATEEYFIKKGGNILKFYNKYLRRNKEGIIYLSKEIYYSNIRVEEFIDQVILCDFEGSDSLVIGKNSEGDFMFYLGTDIGS